jgi:RNA polymerase sigma-70 factor (ECF subfamily)
VDNGRKAKTADAERLVKASQAGDRTAFDMLVRLHQKRAMQVAVGILGSADEAAEAVQVGFVKAYLSIKKLRNPGQFNAWLLRIIANAAITQARAAKRRAEKTSITDCYEDKKTVSPGEKESGDELKEAIQRAMLKLSKKEAQAISFFGLQDLSHREVAEIMGCSVEAVRWNVFNARKKLKILLKEYLE